MIKVDGTGAVYYMATDQTVHQMYVSGGNWVDLNITTGIGTAARVEAGAASAIVELGQLRKPVLDSELAFIQKHLDSGNALLR